MSIRNSMLKGNLALIVMAFMLALLIIPYSNASSEPVCAVYFSGIGCSHCAKVDPVLFGSKVIEESKNLVIIDYEIFKEEANPAVMTKYTDSLSLSPGVPLIIFGKDVYLRGDSPILDGIDNTLSSLHEGNPCPLPNGGMVSFDNISISSLEGTPKIWVGDRVLIKTKTDAEKIDDATLRDLLFGDYPDLSACSAVRKCIAPEPVQYSGGEIIFENAAIVGDGWVLQWGRKGVEKKNLQNVGMAIIVIFLIVIVIGVYLKETSVGKERKHKERKKKK